MTVSELTTITDRGRREPRDPVDVRRRRQDVRVHLGDPGEQRGEHQKAIGQVRQGRLVPKANGRPGVKEAIDGLQQYAVEACEGEITIDAGRGNQLLA